MPKIKIERSSEWNNKLREIGIYINGNKAGIINDGETKEFEVDSGHNEIYAKIDWCSSKKLIINTSEDNTTHIKLSGFKFGNKLLVIIIGFFALYYSLKYFVGLDLGIHVIWFPLILFLYPTYYITLGRENYLILKVIQKA